MIHIYPIVYVVGIVGDTGNTPGAADLAGRSGGNNSCFDEINRRRSRSSLRRAVWKLHAA